MASLEDQILLTVIGSSEEVPPTQEDEGYLFKVEPLLDSMDVAALTSFSRLLDELHSEHMREHIQLLKSLFSVEHQAHISPQDDKSFFGFVTQRIEILQELVIKKLQEKND